MNNHLSKHREFIERCEVARTERKAAEALSPVVQRRPAGPQAPVSWEAHRTLCELDKAGCTYADDGKGGVRVVVPLGGIPSALQSRARNHAEEIRRLLQEGAAPAGWFDRMTAEEMKASPCREWNAPERDAYEQERRQLGHRTARNFCIASRMRSDGDPRGCPEIISELEARERQAAQAKGGAA